MKKDEFIKLGLDEETAKKCETASVEELKGFIPKVRFDEVNNDKKKLEIDVRDRDSQLDALKNSTGNVEDLKKQIADLQADNKSKDEAHIAEIAKLKIDSVLDLAITDAKGKNAKAITALLDMSKAVIDKDGNVTGLKEQIEALAKAEDTSFLFDSTGPRVKGAKPGESATDNADRKPDASKMSYEDFAAAENTD